MKILKIVLIALAGIIAMILIAAAHAKKDYAVKREIVINKPKQQVFDYIKLLRNQDNFSKWAKMDPNMKRTITGTDETVGFVSAWESNAKDVGAGEQEIKKITDSERLDFELRFLKPWKSTNYAYMTTESLDTNQTSVKWGFNGTMAYPMNLMLVFMDMDKMLGKEFQTGLDNLKEILEKQ